MGVPQYRSTRDCRRVSPQIVHFLRIPRESVKHCLGCMCSFGFVGLSVCFFQRSCTRSLYRGLPERFSSRMIKRYFRQRLIHFLSQRFVAKIQQDVRFNKIFIQRSNWGFVADTVGACAQKSCNGVLWRTLRRGLMKDHVTRHCAQTCLAEKYVSYWDLAQASWQGSS